MKNPKQTTIKISHDIPVPRPRLSGLMVTLKAMEVGDSIEFPYNRLSAYAYALAPKKFTIRKMGESYRCWRIA